MKGSDNRQFQLVIRIRHNATIYRPISCPKLAWDDYLGGFDGSLDGGLLVGGLLVGGLCDDCGGLGGG